MGWGVTCFRSMGSARAATYCPLFNKVKELMGFHTYYYKFYSHMQQTNSQKTRVN